MIFQAYYNKKQNLNPAPNQSCYWFHLNDCCKRNVKNKKKNLKVMTKIHANSKFNLFFDFFRFFYSFFKLQNYATKINLYNL